MFEKIRKGLAMKEDERRAAVSKLSRSAKEAMKEWKRQTGIKAIVPKTKNQKAELRHMGKRARIRDYHESKKISLGAASAVRLIKPEEK